MATWTATAEKTKTASQMGQYQRTAIDDRKAFVAFLITGHVGRRTEICWNITNRVETVTAGQLEKLKAAHDWATDF